MKLLAAIITVVPPLWVLLGMFYQPAWLPPFLNGERRLEQVYGCWDRTRSLRTTLHSHVQNAALEMNPMPDDGECPSKVVPAVLTGEDPIHEFTPGAMAALQFSLPEGHVADDFVLVCPEKFVLCLKHGLGTGEAQPPISARARLEAAEVKDSRLLARASTDLTANPSAFRGLGLWIELALQMGFLFVMTVISVKLGGRLARRS